MVNSFGVSVVEMGSIHTRTLTADNGCEHMLHSLESANYLKVDKKNFIRFEFATDDKSL